MASVSNKFTKVRDAIDAVDASNPTNENVGVNFAGYDIAMFNIIPSGGANPSVEILVWSPTAGKYISASPAITHAGAGADTSYSITEFAYGRNLFVKITALAAGSVHIEAKGRRTGDVN